MKSQVGPLWLSPQAETALVARVRKMAATAEVIQAIADQMAVDELFAELADEGGSRQPG